MSDENKNLPNEKEMKEAANALSELRKVVESKMAESTESKARIAKLEEHLDKFEEKNQALVASQAQDAKAMLEATERMNELEAKLSRAPNGSDNEEVKRELKAFEILVQKGAKGLDPDEMKYLRTDNDVDGGYLAPPEYVQEIIKDVTEISMLRQVARVRRTSRGEILIPKRTALLQGGFRGEGGLIVTDNSQYGMVKIVAHHLDVIVPITNTMLTDSAFNMETEINADVIENLAKIEGASFVNGVLVTEPEGYLQNAGVQELVSGIANDIDPDNFFDLQGELKAGYQGAFTLNRKTLARTRKLKDGQDRYLFAPAADGMSATIGGDPYIIMPDMPDIAADATPVAYGDWLRGYTIVDGVQMTVLRDPYTLADTGKTRFVFSKRVGGRVTQPEAIKKLKCST